MSLKASAGKDCNSLSGPPSYAPSRLFSLVGDVEGSRQRRLTSAAGKPTVVSVSLSLASARASRLLAGTTEKGDLLLINSLRGGIESSSRSEPPVTSIGQATHTLEVIEPHRMSLRSPSEPSSKLVIQPCSVQPSRGSEDISIFAHDRRLVAGSDSVPFEMIPFPEKW